MTTNMKRLLMGALLAAGVAGCQLIVDFDRTLIDAGGVDASFDTSKPETSTDSGTDTSTDAAKDAAKDAATDAATDADDGSTADADDGSADAAAE